MLIMDDFDDYRGLLIILKYIYNISSVTMYSFVEKNRSRFLKTAFNTFSVTGAYNPCLTL